MVTLGGPGRGCLLGLPLCLPFFRAMLPGRPSACLGGSFNFAFFLPAEVSILTSFASWLSLPFVQPLAPVGLCLAELGVHLFQRLLRVEFSNFNY